MFSRFHYSPADVQRVCVSSLGVQLLASAGCPSGSLYLGASSGATQGASYANFSAPVRAYALTLPYIMALLDVRIDANSSSNVLSAELRPQTPRALTQAVQSTQFAIAVGSNSLAFNSSPRRLLDAQRAAIAAGRVGPYGAAR